MAIIRAEQSRRRVHVCRTAPPRLSARNSGPQGLAGPWCTHSSRRLTCIERCVAAAACARPSPPGPHRTLAASQGCRQVGALAIAHVQHQAPGMRQALHQRHRARLPQAQALQVLLCHACMPARPVRPRCIAPWTELAWQNTGHTMKAA